MNVSSLEDAVDEDAEDERIWKNSLNLIDEACTEIRNVSHNMMPNVLIKSGLSQALRELADKINAAGQLKVLLDAPPLNGNLDETTEVGIYRIVQEILNNTIKHSEASEAKITCVEKMNSLLVQVKDNGKGIDLAKIKNSKGIGWKNIQSRVELLNGSLNIETNKGTEVNIEVRLDT